MSTIKIELFGTSFTIQASEDKAYLEKLVAYYSKIAEDVSHVASVKTSLQASILAGIMLCDELHKEKSNIINLQQGLGLETSDMASSINIMDETAISRKTQAMIDNIDEVLNSLENKENQE